jgi:hypothetical protein
MVEYSAFNRFVPGSSPGQPIFFKENKSPQVGFEPTTNRLTVDRSATELLRN